MVAILSTWARPPTVKTFSDWGTIRIEKILPSLRRIIVPGDKIANDGQVRKFSAPASPLTDAAEGPSLFGCIVLTTSTAKGMCAVCLVVNPHIKEVLSELLEEIFRCLVSEVQI